MGTQPNSDAIERAEPILVSSPAATGGAGVSFEQHVGAYFLGLLLTRGFPPVLGDCSVSEVAFQTQSLGWNTDDLLVEGEVSSGGSRKLLMQVKRSFVLSANDDECRATIEGFWHDFNRTDEFFKDRDQLAVVTLRGTNRLLTDLGALLEAARAASTPSQFQHHIDTDGLLSRRSKTDMESIQSILASSGDKLSVSELHPFLRCLHVFSLDFQVTLGFAESQIKSLLAHAASSTDNPVETANTTWDTLVNEAGDAAVHAKRIRYSNLPSLLTARHDPIRTKVQAVLESLSDHSQPILAKIRDTLAGDINLDRSTLVTQAATTITTHQVTILSGPGGSGKSALAKKLVEHFSKQEFTFAFKASEFGTAHLDHTLSNAGFPGNTATLEKSLKAQAGKLILIDGVDRLLEAEHRDALQHLLQLVGRDPSWKVLMTCRDYSTDLVRSSMLGEIGGKVCVVDVPLLNDTELDLVASQGEKLSTLLAGDATRHLLRNLYYLDCASQLEWESCIINTEISERAFRKKFWREMVQKNGFGKPSDNAKRHSVFEKISVRRAKAMSPFASTRGLDIDTLSALLKDGLLTYSDESGKLAAPRHDVLEDWALLSVIDHAFELSEHNLDGVAEVVGTYPAIRRAYRKWLYEFVSCDPVSASTLFGEVLDSDEYATHFRDDTIVSFLQSDKAPAILAAQIADNVEAELLSTLINLLRVGCTAAPTWFSRTTAGASIIRSPSGPAWPAVLDLVAKNLLSFSEKHFPLLLGLLEDFCRSVSWQTPYPDGAKSTVAIAEWLLPQFDDYQHADELERTVKVITHLPLCAKKRFASLIPVQFDSGERDRVGEKLCSLALSEMHGLSAARDFPDSVVAALREKLFLTDAWLEKRHHYSSFELDDTFGLRHGGVSKYFPQSALKGPFIHLLRFSSPQGLAFVIELANHSAEWFGEQKAPTRYVEPPTKIKLVMPNGTHISQWVNPRLWGLYRPVMPAPNSIECAMMALEHWLLELADSQPSNLDEQLLDLLLRSRSVSVTAVVAGVATAHPRLSAETLCVLLRSRECIQLDKWRMAKESEVRSLPDILPTLRSEQRIFNDERRQSNRLPHRQRDLETAAVDLQLTSRAEEIQQIIDAHKALLPKSENRCEEDRLWGLALHRMDLRNYSIRDENKEQTSEDGEDTEASRRIDLDIKPPEADIQRLVDQSSKQLNNIERQHGLLNWAVSVFEGRDAANYRSEDWSQKLQDASSLRQSKDITDPGRNAIEGVAAVCLRDHGEELKQEDHKWAVSTVIAAVWKGADHFSSIDRIQRCSIGGDRLAAYCLSGVLANPLHGADQQELLVVLVTALTHANKEVRYFATVGIGRFLWKIDRQIVHRCIYALAWESNRLERRLADEFDNWPERYEKRPQLEYEVSCELRKDFYSDEITAQNSLDSLDVHCWSGAEAIWLIAEIASSAPEDDGIGKQVFKVVAKTLVEWVDKADDRNLEREEREDRPDWVEIGLERSLEKYLLRVPITTASEIASPLLSAIDDHPKYIADIIDGLVGEEDRTKQTDRFWALWQLFADKLQKAPWLTIIDEKHAAGRPMLASVFLTNWWKKGIRHWESVEGHTNDVTQLFQSLPPSAVALENFLRFLYHIGETALPAAFEAISDCLKESDTRTLLSESNTTYFLETLLQRYVYGRPAEVKKNPKLRVAILHILDVLVENGSSSAYRMRDDFVTPLRAT